MHANKKEIDMKDIKDYGRGEVMDHVEHNMRALGITTREDAARWLADQPVHLAELTTSEDQIVADRFDH